MKIIKDKKGMQFKSILFAIVAMSMVIFAVGTWVDEWNRDYDSNITWNLGDYNKLDDMSDYASSSKGTMAVKSSFDSGAGADFEGTSLRGAFGVINNIFTPFNIVLGEGGLIDSIEDQFGIPNYITIGVVTLILFAIIFSIIALFFRKATPA